MEDKVLETVINGIEYNFLKDILIKPLPAIMVTKEITEQIPTGEKDEEGFNKYDTKTETKEVESDWATGVVLAIPEGVETKYEVGNTVIYNKRFAMDFDLFKDSKLVKPYDIIAIKK